jgi:hypothetical protein
MNKKAFELAISTLILIILGVLVLIAIIYAVTDGFKNFSSTTAPFTDTATSTAIKQSCQNACDSETKLIYCCSQYDMGNIQTNCTDPRLEVTCTLDCSDFVC